MQSGPHNLDGKKIDPKKAERRDGKMFVGGVKGETPDNVIQVSRFKLFYETYP